MPYYFPGLEATVEKQMSQALFALIREQTANDFPQLLPFIR
jgi:hypothetical protein